jgi:EmrB/QacA subfamily drug resistance transporter
MDLLDSTVVNVALPTLGREFSAGDSSLEWVVTGYLLSLAVWIPASGWLGDRFGTKRVFLFGLATFVTGSALCGFAQDMTSLIAFRVLQGVGGGMVTPVGTAMLFRAFPPNERATAAAVLSVPTVLAPGVGPVLGGWLVDEASWRWIFFVNLPIGVAAFLFSAVFLREHREESAGRFDPAGFLLSAAGLALVLYTLSVAPQHGWTSPEVVISGVAGLICLAALVVVELRQAKPMLHLRLYANRMFRSASLTMFMSFGVLLGVLFILPLFLQELRGLSAFDSGLTTFPQALGVLASAQIASRLYKRTGPRAMLTVGLSGLTFTSGLFLLVDLGTSLWWIRGIMLLRGASLGFAMVASQAATFATIRPEETGRASSLFSAMRQVAASVGVAVLATVLIERGAPGAVSASAGAGSTSAAVQLQAYHDAFAASMVFGFIGIFFALRIHDEDARDTR